MGHFNLSMSLNVLPVFILFHLLGTCTATATPVWIDTDPSVGIGEVDDGLALIQAMNSRALDIRGIGVVYGNAGVKECNRVAMQLADAFSEYKIPVYEGAASAEDDTSSDAAYGLAKLLKTERIVVVALGPLTNIARTLRLNPALAANITQLVAVAGRRELLQFRVGSMTDSFPDLNFEKDASSFKFTVETLLKYNSNIVLAPWEISSNVWLTKDHLQMMQQAIVPDITEFNVGAAVPLSFDEALLICQQSLQHRMHDPSQQMIGRCANLYWVLEKCTHWADLWIRSFGTNGFNPFDTLAVGYLTDYDLYECDNVRHEFVGMELSSMSPVIEAEIVNDLSIHIAHNHDAEGSSALSERMNTEECGAPDADSFLCSAHLSAPQFVLTNSSTFSALKYCRHVNGATFLSRLMERLSIWPR